MVSRVGGKEYGWHFQVEGARVVWADPEEGKHLQEERKGYLKAA